jgi:hypothetical protein
MDIYRITRTRTTPSYYQAKTETVYGTWKRAFSIFRASQRKGYIDSIKIEYVPITGEWMDVTDNFRNLPND